MILCIVLLFFCNKGQDCNSYVPDFASQYKCPENCYIGVDKLTCVSECPESNILNDTCYSALEFVYFKFILFVF
jgi:hypothetical protein